MRVAPSNAGVRVAVVAMSNGAETEPDVDVFCAISETMQPTMVRHTWGAAGRGDDTLDIPWLDPQLMAGRLVCSAHTHDEDGVAVRVDFF